MHELKACSVCGATELIKKGSEEHDGQVFGLYQCPSCDSELSAYSKYLKTAKPTPSAKHAEEALAEQPAKEALAPIPQRTAVVNVAASVYQKAIGGTLQLVARLGDFTMNGTGTVISDEGYFITNAHVVTEMEKNHTAILNYSEEVSGQSGENKYRFLAELVYVKPSVDLALLKTEPHKDLVPVTFSEQDAFPGESVYAIGNSKGEGLCIVEGIVSDIHRKIGAIDAIMISAPVTHGNSGGPVFDADGKLLGIVQSGRADVSAMNYVIPVETILEFLEEAKEKEDLSF